MSDYISREAAKQILSVLLVKDAAECACNLVDCVLPADVEPVRHGNWNIRVSDERTLCLECSVCGRKVDNFNLHRLLIFGEYGEACRRYPYCHCGAKMDLEDETNDDKGLCNPRESGFCSYGQAPINQEERWLKTI